MKRAIIAVFLFCNLATSNLLLGQPTSAPQIQHDSIAYYENLGDFDNRYRIVKSHEDSLRKLKLYIQIKDTDSLYTYMPNNAADSTTFRYYLKHHAYKYKKYLGDYDSALHFYQMANQFVVDRELLDEHGIHIEGEIGNIYARRNDFNKAVLFLTSTIPYLKKEEKYDRLSRLCSDIGNVYKWLGDYKQMLAYYMEGIRLSKQSNEYRGLQSNYAGLADYEINYVTSEDYDHHLIATYLEASRQAILDNPKSDSYRSLRLMNIEEMRSSYYLNIDSLEAALKSTLISNRIAKEEYKSVISREISKSEYRIADVYLRLGDVDKSEAHVDSAFRYLAPNTEIQGLPLINQIYDENTFTDLLSLKARIYKRKYLVTGDHKYLDSILLSINLAFNANDGLESYLTMQASKLISAGQNKQMVGQALEVYALYDGQNIQYSSHEVRKIFDRSKSRILTENQRKASILKQLKESDKVRLTELENDLLKVLSVPSDEAQLKVEHRIRSQIDSLKSSGLDQETLIRHIKEPYVEYVDLDSVFYMLTHLGKLSSTTINQTSEIDSLIEKVDLALHKQSSEGLDPILQKLYSLLMPLDIEKIDIINLIPDGRLSYFPFDLLKQGDEYLIRQVAIKYQQSAIQSVSNFNRNIEKSSMLCLSPSYNESLDEDESKNTRGGLSKLLYTKSEVDGIGEVYTGKMTQYESLSFEELNHQLKNVEIFHYAGHAIARNDSAYLIQMIDDQEELLLDKQIFEMTNQLDLVTLSACETGLGTYHAGEGVSSLATSFLNSGAKAIVYSLWNANDASTATIMKEFYSQLASGKKKSSALRQAKLNYLENTTPDGRHPYYWAAFSLVGNDQSITNTSNQRIFIAGIALLFLIVLSLLFQNKNQNK